MDRRTFIESFGLLTTFALPREEKEPEIPVHTYDWVECETDDPTFLMKRLPYLKDKDIDGINVYINGQKVSTTRKSYIRKLKTGKNGYVKYLQVRWDSQQECYVPIFLNNKVVECTENGTVEIQFIYK